MQEAWLQRLELEHDNLRAALGWSLRGGREAELGLRISGALGEFWHVRGYLSEGSRWLERGLAFSRGASPSPVRAKALSRAGWIAIFQGDGRAMVLLEESVNLYRELEDKAGVATSLANLGWAVASLQMDKWRLPALVEEAEALRREPLDRRLITHLLHFLAMAAMGEDDFERAAALVEENLALLRELGDVRGIIIDTNGLAMIALLREDHERAAELFEENMRRAWKLGDKLGSGYGLLGLAGVAGLRGESARAARLWGAAEALHEAIGLHLSPIERSHYAPYIATARARLDEASWEALWAEGRAMALEQAVDYALGERPPPPGEEPAPPPAPSPAEAKARPELLRIFALGLARVERGEHALASSEWTHPKSKELLYYLLSHPPCTKEQIGLDLWPDASPSQLRSSFHPTLHRLRKALGEGAWILFEDGRYAFNRSLKYLFDVEVFESNLLAARRLQDQAPEQAIQHLQEAVEVYRGDFLEDFAADSEWALQRQEQLRRAYGEALLSLGGLLREEGRHGEAADAYRKAIAHDGYQEAAHRELMRCYVALGERGRALRHYGGLVELLRDELGSLPASETRALYESLRRGEGV